MKLECLFLFLLIFPPFIQGELVAREPKKLEMREKGRGGAAPLRATPGLRRQKPLVSKEVAQDGAKVDVRVQSVEHSMFELSGKGFKPHESIKFTSTSCGEVISLEIQADQNGDLPPMGLSPAVVGEAWGICQIDLVREQEKDSLHLEFPWGKR